MNLYKALIKTCYLRFALCVASTFTALQPTVLAQPADIASQPIFSTIAAAVEVKPNIMMVLDDSGSMSWSYMPDAALNFRASLGYNTPHCNGVYYNPAIKYTPPKDANGNNYPDQDFYKAQYDGFNVRNYPFNVSDGLGYINLSNSFQDNLYTTYSNNNLYYNSSKNNNHLPSPYYNALYSIYTGSQTSEKLKKYHDTNSTFYQECLTGKNPQTGLSVFKLVIVSSTSGIGNSDERTNFANWFSYYRTRMLMMKTGTGQAFSKINNKFRVGYMTINNATGTDFLNITEFSTDNKRKWFEQLYKSKADGATPLREALADSGKIYAGKKSTHNGQPVTDPVQYSCQQNYTILSTDGYWNGTDANVTKLDGTVMDNQDQNLPRPYKDDSGTTYQQTTTQEQQTKFYWSTNSQQIQKLTWWYSWGWKNSGWFNASSCYSDYYTDCRNVDMGTTRDPAQCPSNPANGPTTSTSSTGLVKTCSYVLDSFNYVAPNTCTPANPIAANNYVTTQCSIETNGPTELTSCTPQAPVFNNNFMKIICSAPYIGGGTPNTLADSAAYYYNTNLRTPSLGNCIGKGADGTTTTNLCLENKVPASIQDPATWQHMTTFTLGLGARGRMVFSRSYLDDTSGDFFDIKNGNNASSTNCTWGVSGQPCNWPKPGSNQIENIDDLWHAAVNGHGNYFSATDPEGLANALSSSLSTIVDAPQPGTAASASTSNPKITSSNNFQFSSYFKSLEWTGELIRQPFNLKNGSVPPYNHLKPDPAMYDWSAQAKLSEKTYTDRNIYFKGSTTLVPFNWDNLKTAQLNAYFEYDAIKSGVNIGISQFCSTASTTCIDINSQKETIAKNSGAAGEALVNFLRGDRSNEEGPVSDKTKFYRKRAHVLGDIVSAQPLYVGAPTKTYTDAGYASFKSAQAQRKAMVFGAANDGMLHAFDVETGEEKWTFIPTAMLPKLHILADKKYADKHTYFVEGTPKSGDVFINGEWKTILVGGFNAGGTGYYALDITNPLQPIYLWEFTNTNMGLTFGNPEITKLDNGTWVVLVASGYNNCTKNSNNCATTSGDGKGYLYILDAKNGTNYTTPISTGAGNASGLAYITAQAGTDNVTKKVYGGDLQGNLWRFNIETTGTNRFSKQKIAVFKDENGNLQPITTRPQVTTHNGFTVVLVGTGRYLGVTDVGASQRQTFYAIKDNVSTTPYENIRSDGTFIKKTAVDGKCPAGVDREICEPNTQIRTVTINTGSVATDSLDNKNGWFLDFPANAGELSITDPKLVRGSVTFTTSVPVASTAAVCGESNAKDPVSFSYTLSYRDGGAINSSVAASSLGVGISTSPQIIQLPDGNILVLTRTQSGTTKNSSLRISANAASNNIQAKRTSWRELR